MTFLQSKPKLVIQVFRTARPWWSSVWTCRSHCSSPSGVRLRWMPSRAGAWGQAKRCWRWDLDQIYWKGHIIWCISLYCMYLFVLYLYLYGIMMMYFDDVLCEWVCTSQHCLKLQNNPIVRKGATCGFPGLKVWPIPSTGCCLGL